MADSQPTLFDTGRRRWRPRVSPHFADAVDVPRLTGHNGRLLERLRRGAVMNTELFANPKLYGRLPSHRISDVRLYLEGHGETVGSKRLGKVAGAGPCTWLYWIEAT